MRSTLHLSFTVFITFFVVYQNYQLRQYQNTEGIIEESNGNIRTIVEVDNMNILLAHVDNHISVAMEGVPPKNLKVSFPGGEVTPKGNGTFKLKPNKIGGHMIYVKGINQKGESCGYKRVFSVQRLPVEVGVGGKATGHMGANQMKAQRGIHATASKFGFDARMSVANFQLSLFREEAAFQTVYNEGEKFSGDALKLIKQAQSGDRYFFTNIKVKGLDGSTRNLQQSMLFEIQ